MLGWSHVLKVIAECFSRTGGKGDSGRQVDSDDDAGSDSILCGFVVRPLFCSVARNESATASVYPAKPGAVIVYRFAGCYFDLGDCLLQLYQYELEPADAAVKDDSCGETNGWNAS